jgi:PD-(D/E)XK nuclease superfamily
VTPLGAICVHLRASVVEISCLLWHEQSRGGSGRRMQCTNYLTATGLQLCLLLDFGKPRLEIKRVAHGL